MPISGRISRRHALAGAVAVAGLAACARTAGSKMGLSKQGLEMLTADLQRHVAEQQPPGLVAAVARGAETHVIPLGVMTLGGPPVPRDAIFRIASMTKPITAIAAMMLVEEGKLKLDEPIAGLAPELANLNVLTRIAAQLDETVPARRQITLEDVLTFRLGWGVLFDDVPIMRAAADVPGFGMPNPSSPMTSDEFMARLGRLPLMAQPGERWLYTVGANVLGVLVARAAGKPLDAVLQERVLGPLGMVDTGFHAPAAKADKLITGYVNDNGKLALFEPYNDMFLKAPAFPAGDSGLVSTADDYAAFARFMFSGQTPDGRRLIKAETLKDMTTNRLTPAQRADGVAILGQGRGWGLGLGVQVEAGPYGLQPGSYGWDGGFGTSWFNDPAKGLTAILLTQRVFDGPEPPDAHKTLVRNAYGAAA